MALLSFNAVICSSLIKIEQAIIHTDAEQVEHLLKEQPLTAAQQNGFLDLAQQWIKNTKQAYKRFIILECRHSMWPFFAGIFSLLGGGSLLAEISDRPHKPKLLEIAAGIALIGGAIGVWIWGYKKVSAEKERILTERLNRSLCTQNQTTHLSGKISQ